MNLYEKEFPREPTYTMANDPCILVDVYLFMSTSTMFIIYRNKRKFEDY